MHRQRMLMTAACAALVVAGCARSPRQRPLETTPIATGEGTMEAERKRLEGRWTLVSLTVATESGQQAAVDAVGMLVFDGFGNLRIEYRMSEAGRRTLEGLGIAMPSPVLSIQGSVAIDPVAKQIVYAGADVQKRALGFDPDLAARRANPFTLERARYYRFDGENALTLTTRHENGSDAATAHWKKGS